MKKIEKMKKMKKMEMTREERMELVEMMVMTVILGAAVMLDEMNVVVAMMVLMAVKMVKTAIGGRRR